MLDFMKSVTMSLNVNINVINKCLTLPSEWDILSDMDVNESKSGNGDSRQSSCLFQ